MISCFDHMTDENQAFLRKIAFDSFFRNLLSPFRQGPLRLQWPEIPSRALHPDSRVYLLNGYDF